MLRHVNLALVSWNCRAITLVCAIIPLYISLIVYGWVQDIAEDRHSAIPQDDIYTEEGENVSLNIYSTKNGPRNFLTLSFTVETSGSATGMIMHVHVF